jgi:hypothetical protein
MGGLGERRAARISTWAAVLPLGLMACSSSESPPDAACPRETAAFRLEVTAADGDLPGDVSIVVRYQGNIEETFTLPSGPGANVDVCCEPVAEALGSMPGVRCPGVGLADVGVAGAVYCELWTGAVAEVTVRGGDYPEVVQTLQAESREDECGLETTSVRLVLAHPDGGQ